jgi:hypothetical protein
VAFILQDFLFSGETISKTFRAGAFFLEKKKESKGGVHKNLFFTTKKKEKARKMKSIEEEINKCILLVKGKKVKIPSLEFGFFK